MRLALTICGLVLMRVAFADAPATWTPKIDFQLEDSDYSQTLVWLSGWSYALTQVGRTNSQTKFQGSGVCVSSKGFVESRVLLDALNSRFKGQRITSEQAAPVLFAAAKAAYGCHTK